MTAAEKNVSSLGTTGIRNRIMFVVGLLLLLLMVAAAFDIYEVTTLTAASNKNALLYQKWAFARFNTRSAQAEFKTQVQEWKNILLRGHRKEDYDKHLKGFEEQEKLTTESANKARSVFSDIGLDASAIDEFIQKHQDLGVKYRAALASANLTEPNGYRSLDAAVRGIDRGPSDVLEKLVETITTGFDTYVKQSSEASDKSAGLARMQSFIILGIAIAFTLVAAPYLIRTINGIVSGIRTALDESNLQRSQAEALREKLDKEYRNLQENIMNLLQVVAEASDGNLAVRAKVTEGSLGNVADAFNQMMESISDLVREIQKLAQNTQSVAKEIGSTSEKLAEGATSQSNALDTASHSVSNMGQLLGKVSVNAETAAAAAKRTQDSALQGSNSAQNVVRGMEVLRQNVQAGAKKIKNLGDRSMEITGIVGAIAKISDQTNMLALNAAIEAARAGEHGRGFSVVADEVRKLAERTAAATQEIERLVRDIQTETNESVAAIEQQTQVVEEQAAVVNKAGEALQRIQQMGTESAELIGDISVASKTQAQGASSLVQTMTSVAAIAKSTKERVETSLKVSRNLGQLAAALTQTVGKFRLN